MILLNEELSETYAIQKLEKIFKKFDKASKNGYDVEDLTDLKDDLNEVFEKLQRDYSESKNGSSRAKALISAVRKRL